MAPAVPPAFQKPSPRVPTSKERIALNFKEAEIESVVAAFGNLLNRTFLIDPRVRGKLTLETPQPVSRARAFELLQAALRVQGFAVVDSGTLVRVVPEADAKLQSSAVQVGAAGTGGDQVLTQVFQLNYESATNLVPVLRPLITPNNTITAYPSNNSLVVTDYAANLKRIAQIVASLDREAPGGVELIQIKHAVAADVAGAVERMIEESGRGGKGAQVDAGQRIMVAADPRLNTVMLRSASPEKINLARSLVARLDQPSENPGNIHVVYLRNAEAVKLAQVLRGVLMGNAGSSAGSGSYGGTQSSSASSPSALSGSSAQGAGQSATQSGSSGQGSAGNAQSPGAQSFAAGGAIIAADPSTNSLIITAPDPIYRNLRAVIDRLDARRAQVFIESLIVEVTAERAAEFGVQWQFLNGLNKDNLQGFGGTNLPARGSGGNILDVITNPLAVGQGLNVGVINGTISVGGATITNLGVLARALETRANGNILATPNLLTLDNEEARIIIGQNIPILSGQYAATAATAGTVNPFQTFERRDVGTTLRVRPQISESGTVKMQIFQEVSSLFSQTAQGVITNRRAIESNVLVDDGQIVVLGGLIEEKIEGSEQKVPALGDLPLLGGLFRYDSRKRVKTNLLVFLRPIVLRDANASYGVTGDRYDFIRRLQRNSNLPDRGPLPQFPPSDLAPRPPSPDAAKASGPGSRAGPASLAPDIDRSVRQGEPAPVVESVPEPAGRGSN
ncbi:MAG: type II secretion system secretin GspD [Quisquiliibacterium sp.]